MLDLVAELKAGGSTILMTTHEMQFARDIADRVIFLKGGVIVEPVIVEHGPPAQLFGDPQHPDTREFLARADAH